MRYTEKSTRNLMSLTVLVIVMFIAVLMVGCGGGGKSPTAPPPPTTPTPVPTPVPTTVTFISATPPCGSTIHSTDTITFRIGWSTNVTAYLGITMPSDIGELEPDITNIQVGGMYGNTGFNNVVASFSRGGQTLPKSANSTAVVVHLQDFKFNELIPPVTEPNCSYKIIVP